MDNQDNQEAINYLSKEGKSVFQNDTDMLHAIDMAIEALRNATEPAEWVEVNYDKVYDGGMRLRFNGWRCSNCGFERHKRRGMSKHCEECGAYMRGEKNESSN